jgi:3',5'-cyclic AMP phosphodiesterase CpdA
VISNLNGSYGSARYHQPVHAAVARIVGLKPDLVISTGDMVAGQRRPHLSRPQVTRMWQAFHQTVSDLLAAAGIPLAVTPGNHDGSAYRSFQLERTIYDEQWAPRRPEVRFLDDSGYPFHYAFEFGDTLFVSVDATTVGHLPRQQMEWLRGVLAKHGPDHRRRILFSHVPLWPFAQGREREYIGDPELQALLQEADVDLYLSGHHHTFYPGVKDGVAFVSQSCLGAGPRRLIGAKSKSPHSFTWIEITEDDVRLAAYKAPRFDTQIDWTNLPERIRSSVAELVRADRVDSPVTRLPATDVR